jgi:hypothetical protein
MIRNKKRLTILRSSESALDKWGHNRVMIFTNQPMSSTPNHHTACPEFVEGGDDFGNRVKVPIPAKPLQGFGVFWCSFRNPFKTA